MVLLTVGFLRALALDFLGSALLELFLSLVLGLVFLVFLVLLVLLVLLLTALDQCLVFFG